MSIRDYLAQGRPLLFNGAMGTYYASRSGRKPARCELANLDAPEEIAAIHRAYFETGCNAIRTNTFDVGTNWKTAQRIIKAGCRIALEADRQCSAYVFTDLWPTARKSAAHSGSVRIARDMAPCTDGWYLMTPFRRVSLIARIMKEIR